MTVTVFNSVDRRTIDSKFCERWFAAADELRSMIYASGEGFDPFDFNETATVGILAVAAGRAGLMALPEFVETNRQLPEGRVRAGRCDLWIADPDWKMDWLIEFKVRWFRPHDDKKLVNKMNEAIRAVCERDRQEAKDRWACTVYAPAYDVAGSNDPSAWPSLGRIENLAERVDLAFRMDGGRCPVFILMRRIPKMARKFERYML